jgi:hypothetical protein
MSTWLVYWVLFSFYNVFEFMLYHLVTRIPLYFLGKLIFILWLQYPSRRVHI